MNFILKEITSLYKELKECAKANPKKVLCIIGVLIYTFWDVVLVEASMPFRCAKWKNTEENIFISKEEWQKKYIGVNYIGHIWELSSDLSKTERSYYKQKIILEGKEFKILAINKKYPNMVIYTYIDNSIYFRVHETLFYDLNENNIISILYDPEGKYRMLLSSDGFWRTQCKNSNYDDWYSYLTSY
ncbi:hypothetical protein F480_07650 [Bibersteinia trehalosi Y31]|uniref:Uncharacterized protein n=1 Tax=Bibersteinia trehalosi Y31 TaxID=1261658 RepID=A0A179CZ80_BIBTR|nr:hypothetical protein [Bibersteinia trehalosi]OAQ14920.1 hypothetical protein F480_07650 [Bibersteinia trehalosi Y31]